MNKKPEDKYFKRNNEVIVKVAKEQRKGSGKKFGSPSLVNIEKD